MIHVTLKELERAFRRHRNIWNSAKEKSISDSHKMLLFYTVECGLKFLIMNRYKLRTTDKKNSDGKSVVDFGHDLNELLKSLNLDRYKLPQLTDQDDKQISPEDVHQAWRYGKTLNNQKENKFVSGLNRIMSELNAKI